MLKKEKILELFEILSNKLESRGEKGEVGIVGGAVMCLVFNARASTKDVDAIFKPTKLIRELVSEIAIEENLPNDWLNDGAKGFLQPNFISNDVINLPNLRVWAPDAKYMLAMKCLSARWDSNDRDDVIFLIKFLKLKNAEEVFKIIEHYYPKKSIPPKTKFFIEEIMDF
ncbi:MAG TPA: DUF6036 family nucleotidyltransferase [Oligoflexia bacterium]|nr:DUF6036 family nucleotidyltransferase [Oligoflexia bacterium]HMP49735.1 DUF6036 family nucleotidyltransferase [Oligoflexia bacterium]